MAVAQAASAIVPAAVQAPPPATKLASSAPLGGAERCGLGCRSGMRAWGAVALPVVGMEEGEAVGGDVAAPAAAVTTRRFGEPANAAAWVVWVVWVV